MSTSLNQATTIQTTANEGASTRLALGAARLVAVLHSLLGLSGVALFTVVMPEEALWIHPVLDTGVIALKLAVCVLLLVGALWPGQSAARRRRLLAVAVLGSAAFGLVKLSAYGEQEALVFFAVDALLLALLVLSRPRTGRGAS